MGQSLRGIAFCLLITLHSAAAVCASLESESKTATTTSAVRLNLAQSFVRQVLSPLLKGREKLLTLQFKDEPEKRRCLILVRSAIGGMTLGSYKIILSETALQLPSSAPRVHLQWKKSGAKTYVAPSGQVELPLNAISQSSTESLASLTDLVRALFRADFFLHPMLKPEGFPTRLVPLQLDVVAQIEKIDAAAKRDGSLSRALVILPPGIGKTVIAGEYLRRRLSTSRSLKVIFVVQNREILEEASGNLAKALQLSPTQVKRIYGENSKETIFDKTNATLIATSRTTLVRNIQDLDEWRRGHIGDVVFVFDEAHHLGAEDGEFKRILNYVNRDLKAGDTMLGLTATPWHPSTDIIEHIFNGQIATALLSEQERQDFLKSGRLIQMARLMLFRAMAYGFLSPIMSYRQVRYLEPENEGDPSEQRLLSRRYLNDWSKRYEDLSEEERFAQLKRDLQIHVPLIRQIVKEIRKSERRDENGELLFPNRGVIFVPSIAHANIYSYLLNQRGKHGKVRIESRTYHSKLKPDVRDDNMDWIRDQEVKPQESFRRRTDAVKLPKAVVHKYLFAIDALGEGVDEPRISHLILTRPYSEEDEIGMRTLLQNLGRGSRLYGLKTDFTVTDFTGDLRRLVFHDLDSSLISRFFVEGGEQDFEPFPEIQIETKVSSEVEKPETDVYLDHTTLKDENFSTEQIDVPTGLDRTTTAPSTSSKLHDGILPLFVEKYWTELDGNLGVIQRSTRFAYLKGQISQKYTKTLTWKEFIGMPQSWGLIVDEVANRENSLIPMDMLMNRDLKHESIAGIMSGAAFKTHYRLNPGVVTRILILYGIMAPDAPENRDRIRFDYNPRFLERMEENTPWIEPELRNLSQINFSIPQKEAEALLEIKKMSGPPRIFSALHDLLARGVGTDDEDQVYAQLSWGHVFNSVGFFDLLARQDLFRTGREERALVHNVMTIRSSVALADRRNYQFRPEIGVMTAKAIQDTVIEAGFSPVRMHQMNDQISPFLPVHLLELPDTLVWHRALPFDNFNIVLDQKPRSILNRMKLLAEEHGTLTLIRFIRMVNIALGTSFPETWTVKDVDEAARFLKQNPAPKIKTEFLKVAVDLTDLRGRLFLPLKEEDLAGSTLSPYLSDLLGAPFDPGNRASKDLALMLIPMQALLLPLESLQDLNPEKLQQGPKTILDYLRSENDRVSRRDAIRMINNQFGLGLPDYLARSYISSIGQFLEARTNSTVGTGARQNVTLAHIFTDWSLLSKFRRLDDTQSSIRFASETVNRLPIEMFRSRFGFRNPLGKLQDFWRLLGEPHSVNAFERRLSKAALALEEVMAQNPGINATGALEQTDPILTRSGDPGDLSFWAKLISEAGCESAFTE